MADLADRILIVLRRITRGAAVRCVGHLPESIHGMFVWLQGGVTGRRSGSCEINRHGPAGNRTAVGMPISYWR